MKRIQLFFKRFKQLISMIQIELRKIGCAFLKTVIWKQLLLQICQPAELIRKFASLCFQQTLLKMIESVQLFLFLRGFHYFVAGYVWCDNRGC